MGYAPRPSRSGGRPPLHPSVAGGRQSAEPAIYRLGSELGVGRRPHVYLDHGRLALSGGPAGSLFLSCGGLGHGGTAHGGVDATGLTDDAAATATEPRLAPPFGSRESGRIQPVDATPVIEEVFMGRPAGWMQKLTGRGAMRSPGAPSHRNEIERRFWMEVATGVTR